MTNLIKIGNKAIGEGQPCFVIAEVGANFRISDDPEINFKHALKLINIAIEAKADAVKFQLFRAKKLYVEGAGHADYIGKTRSINQIIQELELPYEWLPKLKKYCDEQGLIFLCTPFDEDAVDQLEGVGIEAYKIASYTISHLPLIKYIASKGKPIIFSTGAANEENIRKAIETILSTGNDQIAMMQCTAKYPAPLETINLNTIPKLKEKFGIPVGLSDHSREPYVAPMGAIALGAKIIEKHYTTDNNLPGPDHSFAILGDELIELVKNIRKMEKCLGASKKEVQPEEKELYQFARRSIYAIKDIKKGDVLSKENVAVLRSGKKEKGIEPEYFNELLGKSATENIKKWQEVQKDDFK